MRKSRLSEEQIIAILKEHEAGWSTAEVCRPEARTESYSLTPVSTREVQHPARPKDPDPFTSPQLSSYARGRCETSRSGAGQP